MKMLKIMKNPYNSIQFWTWTPFAKAKRAKNMYKLQVQKTPHTWQVATLYSIFQYYRKLETKLYKVPTTLQVVSLPK